MVPYGTHKRIYHFRHSDSDVQPGLEIAQQRTYEFVSAEAAAALDKVGTSEWAVQTGRTSGGRRGIAPTSQPETALALSKPTTNSL
jgi:hypothetical protein